MFGHSKDPYVDLVRQRQATQDAADAARTSELRAEWLRWSTEVWRIAQQRLIQAREVGAAELEVIPIARRIGRPREAAGWVIDRVNNHPNVVLLVDGTVLRSRGGLTVCEAPEREVVAVGGLGWDQTTVYGPVMIQVERLLTRLGLGEGIPPTPVGRFPGNDHTSL